MKRFEMLWLTAAVLGLGTMTLQAGESRIWTSLNGTTLEGELVKADATAVSIASKAGKTVEVKPETLSIGDRQFLVESAQVDAKILSLGKTGDPEKDCKVDEKAFIKRTEKAEFGEAKLEMLQTEHFVIAYSGEVQPKIYGEAAERLWNGMASDHMDFRKTWGGKRLLIVVVQDLKTHQAAGQWYFQALKDANKADQAGKLANSWEDGGSKGLQLPPAEAEKYGVMTYDCYFYLPNQTNFKKAMSPRLVHYLASHMIRYATGPVNRKNTFSLFNGHAFYKEIELTGEVQTGVGETAGTDMYKKEHKEGFKDKWAGELKKLVKKGDVKPDLATTLEMDFKDASPENLALTFGFAAYLQSSGLRLSQFDHLLSQIDKAGKMPEAAEIAKTCGFDSVDAFNKDWTAFILGPDFK